MQFSLFSKIVVCQISVHFTWSHIHCLSLIVFYKNFKHLLNFNAHNNKKTNEELWLWWRWQRRMRAKRSKRERWDFEVSFCVLILEESIKSFLRKLPVFHCSRFFRVYKIIIFDSCFRKKRDPIMMNTLGSKVRVRLNHTVVVRLF